MSTEKTRLSVFSFGLALGITWAIGMFFLGLMAWLFDWGVPVVLIMSSMYLGFAPTFWGSVLGALWAFVDWFIGGIIIAWIYNMCIRCGCPVMSKKNDKSTTTENK